MNEDKLESHELWGVQPKKPSMGEVGYFGYFLKRHIVNKCFYETIADTEGAFYLI